MQLNSIEHHGVLLRDEAAIDKSVSSKACGYPNNEVDIEILKQKEGKGEYIGRGSIKCFKQKQKRK
jgi:hypothetical protein